MPEAVVLKVKLTRSIFAGMLAGKTCDNNAPAQAPISEANQS